MDQRLNDASCRMLGDFFATFANATRMRILCTLQCNAKTVTEIADAVGISMANASQHLRIMRDRGAVVADKHAQNVYYKIAHPCFVRVAALIHDALIETSHMSGENEMRLKRQQEFKPSLPA